MRTRPIVVDASVAMKLVVVEDRTAEAHRLISEQNDAALAIVVPPHFLGEVANALHQQVRRSGLQPADARDALDLIIAMEFEVRAPEGLEQGALVLAGQRGLASVYDALYLVLATDSEADFWTDDQRLLRALGDAYPNAYWIGDLESA